MLRKSPFNKRRRRLVDSRMYVRTQILRRLNVLAFYLLVLLLASAVVATCLPELVALQTAKQELAEVQQAELAVNAKADEQAREYRALEQDPYFLEIYGRDRFDLYKEGETIFRFERSE